jgi:hypothetical protein
VNFQVKIALYKGTAKSKDHMDSVYKGCYNPRIVFLPPNAYTGVRATDRLLPGKV